jgi:hypothetical protein
MQTYLELRFQVKMNNKRENIFFCTFNPLNAELNPICHLLALLGAYHKLHVSRIRVKKAYLSLRSVLAICHFRPSER